MPCEDTKGSFMFKKTNRPTDQLTIKQTEVQYFAYPSRNIFYIQEYYFAFFLYFLIIPH